MLCKRSLPEFTDVDRFVFERVVPPNHLLRRLDEFIDFERFHEKLARFYHPTLGRPGDPVLMAKLIFLQYWYSLSDRLLLERLVPDFGFRWFVGLTLEDTPPDASSLSTFRTRLGVEGTQLLMDDLILQAQDRGLLKYRLRLKDATHVLADIAVPPVLGLLAQIRDKLLSAARPFAPEAVAATAARLVEIRAATEGQGNDARLAMRIGFLQDLLDWADNVVPPEGADEGEWARFQETRSLAHKILREATDPKAGDRTLSVHDSDARRGKHGEYYDGFSLDVVMDADSELITAINVLPANGNEGADALALVRHEEALTGNDIEALSVDGAGHAGALLRELQDPEGLNIDVYVPPKESSTPDKFLPADFVEDSAHQKVTCPAGQTSQYRQRDESEHTTIYRFAKKTCEGCPLINKCLSRPSSTGTFGRTVRKSDYEAEYKAVREKAATPEYKAVKKEHPKIERKLSELVRRHGARHARYRGSGKVLCQQLWTVMVVNAKRIVRLLAQRAASIACSTPP